MYGCGYGQVGTRVGIQVGTGEGYTGYYPHRPREEEPNPAERAPEALQGLEWVGLGSGRVSLGVRRVGGPWYHPSGPVGPCRPSLYQGPWNPASGPIRARFHVISLKVSQNG